MSDVTEQALLQAYELIEDDKLSEAEALLKPILEQDADNADAWWLYAHAVADPETARMALNQVLRLDDSYEGAQELMGKLREAYPSDDVEPVAMSLVPPSTLPNLPEDEDVESPDFLSEMDMAAEPERTSSGLDEDFSLDELDDDFDFESGERRRLPVGLILLVLLLILLVVAALVVVRPFGGGTAATTPTAVQQAAVASPTEAPMEATPTMEEVEPTSAPAQLTPEATEDMSTAGMESALLGALADFQVVEGTLNETETQLGNTMLVGVCTTGQSMRDTLDKALKALAGASASVEADAIGVILVDCENGNSTMRVIAVPLADAKAYASGDLSEKDFQARWAAVA